MMAGAGFLSAFDSRTPTANLHLGGLLQGSTYIAGISGGLWIVMANHLGRDKAVLSTISRLRPAFEVPVLHGIASLDVSGLRLKLDNVQPENQKNPVRVSWNETNPLKTPLSSTLINGFLKSNDSSEEKPYNMNTGQILRFYKDLSSEVRPKLLAGFNISFVDYWGRALIRKILPNSKKHVGMSFSSPNLREPTLAFPIICSVERKPGICEDHKHSHMFEFTPFEFGSWDSFLRCFVDIKFLGTQLVNGVPTQHHTQTKEPVCVNGYDNISFVTGTSSSLFNTIVQYMHKMLLTMDSEPTSVVHLLLKMFGVSILLDSESIRHPEYATVSPNPFYAVTDVDGRKGRSIANQETIYLADGGDDGQNIPFHPLLIPHRQVDVIFALDSTSDLSNFPNGTSLRKTSERYHSLSSSLKVPAFEYQDDVKFVFPRTPSEEEFVAKNLRAGPLFLGCEIESDYETIPGSKNRQNSSAKLTSYEVWPNYLPPLIVYTANSNYSFMSNISTFQGTYNDEEVQGMITNGYNVATCANSTEYMTCVGCAITKRSSDRAKLQASSVCRHCFEKYCYR